MTPRAKFLHTTCGDFIVAEDLDQGVSVTNDAEAVVEYLLGLYGNCRIIYKDTMGRWDELAHDGSKFTGFKPMPQCFNYIGTTKGEAP